MDKAECEDHTAQIFKNQMRLAGLLHAANPSVASKERIFKQAPARLLPYCFFYSTGPARFNSGACLVFFFVVNCGTNAAGACRPMSSDHKKPMRAIDTSNFPPELAIGLGATDVPGLAARMPLNRPSSAPLYIFSLYFFKQTIQRIPPRERAPST